MSAAHTPPPWTARDNDYFWEIGSANGLVADLVESTSMFDRKDYGEANAEFIVRAVNSHAELVAALKLARMDVVNLMELLGDADPEKTDEIIAVIDAALTKAESRS